MDQKPGQIADQGRKDSIQRFLLGAKIHRFHLPKSFHHIWQKFAEILIFHLPVSYLATDPTSKHRMVNILKPREV